MHRAVSVLGVVNRLTFCQRPVSVVLSSYPWWSPCWSPSGSSCSMSTAAGAGAGDGAGTGTGTGAEAAPPKLRKLKVYTKTGDKGKSSLYNGTRAPKFSDVFCALGDTDELAANVGVAREFCIQDGSDWAVELQTKLETIQSRLLDVGSAIATPVTSSSPEQLARTEFSEDHVTALERWIDEMEEELPPLRSFILQSGGLVSVHLHLARTVCRRAERGVSHQVAEEEAPAVVGRFMNRLSDFFFVAARFAALKAGVPEVAYKKA